MISLGGHKRRFTGRMTIVMTSLVILLFGSSTVRVFAASCPDGMSTLDCQSLYGNWTAWVPDSGSESCGETSGLALGTADTTLHLTANQVAIANTIIGIAKTENLGQAGAVIGLMVALDESGLKIYANDGSFTDKSGNHPYAALKAVSLPIAHDAVGNNYDSLGVFQQRITANWSTISTNLTDTTAVQQLMNAAYNAEAFFGSPSGTKAPSALSKGLQNVSGWQSMDTWVAAQKVQGSADSTGSNYKRQLSNAQQIVAKYYDGATPIALPVPFDGADSGTPGDPANACTAVGVVAGSIVETAVGLAWPDSGHGKAQSDATPAYQKALPQAQGGIPGDDPWSDCGLFVSTVMISSGADKNYPNRGTGNQLDKLKSEPSKYLDLGILNNSAQVKPGDIFISDGHTFIFVGPQAKSNDRTIAEGSWHDHVPEVNATLSSFQKRGSTYTNSVGNPFYAFRLINQGS